METKVLFPLESLHKKEKNEPHKYINISLLDRAEIDNKTALELHHTGEIMTSDVRCADLLLRALLVCFSRKMR